MSKDNKVILTGKHGRPSTKLAYGTMKNGILVQRRQVFRGKGSTRRLHNQYYRSFQNNDPETLIKLPEFSGENSIIIRWGTREEISTDKGTIIYNTAKAIKNATDKRFSRITFEEQNVPSPRLVNPKNISKSMLPIIARPLIHSKGRNFVTLNSINEFNVHYNRNREGWYYSEFINKDREFRIHAAHGKVLAVMEKVKPSDNKIAWNRAQNDTDPFVYIPWGEVDKQDLKDVLVAGLEAVEALELDFGGVDVMSHNGKPYVLEVNTSPTLNSSPYVAERWGMYFDWLFRSEKRREHWEFDQFEKGKSLIWKNFQLKDEKK